LGYSGPGYIATDTVGNIYIPLYNNGTILKYTQATGQTAPIALLPAGATALNFGGPNLETLYVIVSEVLLDPFTLVPTGVAPGPAVYMIPSSVTGNAKGQIYPAFNVG